MFLKKDGAAFVTNCPIPHGSTFVYNFTVLEQGTYWYHLHTGGVRAEGGYGFLIVKEIKPVPISYDEELTIILSDWYDTSINTILAGLQNNPFIWPVT